MRAAEATSGWRCTRHDALEQSLLRLVRRRRAPAAHACACGDARRKASPVCIGNPSNCEITFPIVFYEITVWFMGSELPAVRLLVQVLSSFEVT